MGWADLQDRGKLEKGLDARRVQAALQQGYVVALEIGIQGELLLRQARLFAKRAQDQTECNLWLQPASPDMNGKRRREEVKRSSQYIGNI